MIESIKKLNFEKKNIIIYLIFFVILFSLTYRVFCNIFIYTYDKDSWNITEFLINYEGGFVRRGLLGQIILIIYNETKILPYYTILFISAINLVLFTTVYVKILSNLKIPIYIFLTPLLICNPIANDFWIRKDLLVAVSFFTILWLLKKKKKLYHLLGFILLIISISIHEGIGFIIFPIIFFTILTNFKNYKELLYLSSSSVIALLYFIITILFFKGNYEVSLKIWNSWINISFPLQIEKNFLPQSAVEALSWDFNYALHFLLKCLKNFNDGINENIYEPIVWLVIFFLFGILLNNLDNVPLKKEKFSYQHKTENIFYSLLQFCTIIPLIIIGCDYGRWIFYWTSSTIALYYLRPLNFNKLRLKKISEKFYEITCFSVSKDFVLLLLFITGSPAYAWKITFYINTTLSFIFLNTISEIVKIFIT